MRKIFEKLKEEFFAVLPPTIFFFVALHAITFIRVLIGLFMLAQLAGVVSSPVVAAHAAAETVIPFVHHHDHHARSGSVHGAAGEHGHQPPGHADTCCALHAFFAGVLPSVAVVENLTPTGERMTGRLTEGSVGITPGGLDHPPKPLP